MRSYGKFGKVTQQFHEAGGDHPYKVLTTAGSTGELVWVGRPRNAALMNFYNSFPPLRLDDNLPVWLMNEAQDTILYATTTTNIQGIFDSAFPLHAYYTHPRN